MTKDIEQRVGIKRFNLQGTEMERILFLSCAFGILLWAIRFIVTGSVMHGFLIWNLFLAYIPYRMTNYLGKAVTTMKSRIKFWFIF